MATQVTKWQAQDGTLFPTQAEAEEYEARKRLQFVLVDAGIGAAQAWAAALYLIDANSPVTITFND